MVIDGWMMGGCWVNEWMMDGWKDGWMVGGWREGRWMEDGQMVGECRMDGG